MKQQTIIKRKVPIVIEQDSCRDEMNGIMADSIEVMENYYRSKIRMLEESLTQLNLLENAKEIYHQCKEIAASKQALRKIFLRKKI